MKRKGMRAGEVEDQRACSLLSRLGAEERGRGGRPGAVATRNAPSLPSSQVSSVTMEDISRR